MYLFQINYNFYSNANSLQQNIGSSDLGERKPECVCNLAICLQYFKWCSLRAETGNETIY